MGTSGSYSGSGSVPAEEIRAEVGNWLAGVGSGGPQQAPEVIIQNVIELIITGAEEEVAGHTSGVQRSAFGFARAAGRAAAGAYAYGNSNHEVLAELGLNYEELSALGDDLWEVTRRIVEAACGAVSDSTIGHEEQRLVAARVADWVLQEQQAGAAPQPDEIVRKAIAFIMFEVIVTEAGEAMNSTDQPDWVGNFVEHELQDSADAQAQRAMLSGDKVTSAEFARAIEDGIASLRRIYGVTN